MERITQVGKEGRRKVAGPAVEALADGGWGGAAIERLAAFEDALELVEQRKREVGERLDALKAQGRLRSSTAQQLLVQKLTFSTILQTFSLPDD